MLKAVQPVVTATPVAAAVPEPKTTPSNEAVIGSPALKPDPVMEMAVPTGPEAGDTVIVGATSVKLAKPVLPAESAASKECTPTKMLGTANVASSCP